jgi:hypothetical protein
MSKAHNKELARFTFDSLPNGLDKEFLKYELGVDLLFDIPYPEILDIFARINSYTVKLDPQEIFNAKYLGYFKQTVYRLGYKYVSYFIAGGILTKAKVTRMAEAELTADLFVSLLDKVQTNKGIEAYYKKYEDDAANLDEVEKKFDRIMSFIGAIYKPEEIRTTNYVRVQLFYTLFTTIGHLIYRVDGLTPVKKTITEKMVGKLRVALDNVSAMYDEFSNNDLAESPKDFREFINASRRGTTDTGARVLRTNFLVEKLLEVI